MIRTLLLRAACSSMEGRVVHQAAACRIERFPRLHQSKSKKGSSASFASVCLAKAQMNTRFGSQMEPNSRINIEVQPFNCTFVRRIGLNRGFNHRGKAVIQYRDPFEDSETSKKKDDKDSAKPVEESINLKGFDVHNYRGWDAVDVSEIDPAILKNMGTKTPSAPQLPTATSQLTRKVIYDGRTSLKGLDKAHRKKLARRAAQTQPTHFLCRTCIVCKKLFKGHGSMLTHLMNASKCFEHLSPEVKMALYDHKDRREEKNDRALLRRKGVVFPEGDSDEDSDDDPVDTSQTTNDDPDSDEENDVNCKKKKDDP